VCTERSKKIWRQREQIELNARRCQRLISLKPAIRGDHRSRNMSLCMINLANSQSPPLGAC
jgi:hypothetical protein